MVTPKSLSKFREFHLKEPKEVVTLHTEIPKIVYPVGFAVQTSYRSNKWHKDNKWTDYIHYWENPTLVCVSENLVEDVRLDDFESDQEFNLGENRKEVVFLGYALDFHITTDDRSKIVINPGTIIRNTNPSKAEEERMEDSIEFPFNDKKDYVVCSPNGRIVYVISDEHKEVYAFLNSKCIVTKHGIEG